VAVGGACRCARDRGCSGVLAYFADVRLGYDYA